jgi:carboxyl-terminal processing protease
MGALLAAGGHAAEQPRILTPTPSSFETLSRFTELLDALQKGYVQPSRINTTVALRGFVRSIDPEADLLTPEEADSTNASADATADIGLTLAIRDGYPTVICPRDGSPAARAPLLAGEQIIAINNIPSPFLRRFETDRLLRGPVDSPVDLRVLDPVTETVRGVRLRRAAPGPPPASALRFLDSGIAYYRLSEFTVDSVESLRTAMTLAKSERASGIILDLRNNPGGAFLAAQAAASFFLTKGAEIGSLEYADPSLHTSFVSDESLKTTAPVILLVNGGTAAEAEVFAAALQDNGRAKLVGSKTFGRGLLTTPVRLANGSVLVMPTAYYMRPSRQILRDQGVTPDVVTELPRETERALARNGFGAFDWKYRGARILAMDVSLAKALSLLTK